MSAFKSIKVSKLTCSKIKELSEILNIPVRDLVYLLVSKYHEEKNGTKQSA